MGWREGKGGAAHWERGWGGKTTPFNFLKTFQHLFCTLTYANSKGPQWLGSHFRPSVEPESSSAVKWERRSAVWKWISLAEIRGSPQRAMHSLQQGKRTAVQIVFGTLSTCYFISQMENNNTDSGVGTTAAHRGCRGGLAPSKIAALLSLAFFTLICKVIFVRTFDWWNSGIDRRCIWW